MLALVKTPHIELTLNATSEADALEFLKNMRQHYVINVLIPQEDAIESSDNDEKFEDYFETDLWKKFTPGDLLLGTRMKHQLTQAQLAEKSGIHQVTISDYETGRRKLSKKAAYRLALAMGEDPERFFSAPNK